MNIDWKRWWPAVAAVLLLGVISVWRLNAHPSLPKWNEEPQVTVEGREGLIPIEEYVMGVVGGEMGKLPAAGQLEGTDWPIEAYAAQAILARTFILSWLESNNWTAIPTDVTKSQAYRPDNITPAIEQAVNSTRGQVIQSRGKLVRTFFHSYAGGKTATPEEGLNWTGEKLRYIQSKDLPENEFVPEELKDWTAEIPLSHIAQVLGDKGINLGDIRDIRINKMGPSERILEVTIKGTIGETVMHGADFRVQIGPERLRSTKVDPDSFKVVGDNLVARGTGFGHGVGLSQWDAYRMAKEGMNAEQIIRQFFTNIKIDTLWD
jgi:stage II sporulation protein D